ncbi:tubulin-like doman-containing protein [Planctomycetota bacterium]
MSKITADYNVLGYTLREPIGHGGYGEVWSAVAPGGMMKAVKFIYGFHDEERAVREQRSLDRIKDLRHPFLLSLERIEVSEGRLIVVTELANMSLKDRFDQYQAKGVAGIPRNELLGFLRDAADALDYMNHSHSLQHLDVKPENLLIVGGHIKVADFGLVKEIQDVEQSFTGGLTPAYASPELFDGSPSSASDQYSLAILYQEMLTGTRPFPGNTVAQLAAQHVQQQPNLESLSRGDQAVIARALEKSPGNRYKNCTDLISELRNRTISRSESSKTVKTNPRKSTRRQTEKSNSSYLTETLRTSLCSQALNVTAEKLAAVEYDPESVEFQPAIFVSVGETATSIMRAVRKRITDRVGGMEDSPAFRFLCMDTDTKHLRNACIESPNGSLYFDDVLPLPLRNPMEYRDEAELHTSWLSRRWIYNIPRTLQTEGLRPLGRLAFADHHQDIFDRLHDLVEEATLPETVSRTAEATGLAPGKHTKPRVFVVGSISGGAASGMIIDVAFAIRTVLIEQGFGDAEVTGILTYTSGRSASQKNLGMANTFSCLSELHHFHVNSYPGDSACKIPSFDSEQNALDSTYLVDMTGCALPEEYTDTVEMIGEYLYLNAVSRCSDFFDQARASAEQPDCLSFRTIGLSSIAPLSQEDKSHARQRLLDQVTRSWTESHSKGLSDDIRSLVTSKLEQHGLTPTSLAKRFHSTIQAEQDVTPEMVIASLMAECMQSDEAVSADDLFRHVNKCLAVRKQTETTNLSIALKGSLDQQCNQLEAAVGDDLCNVILSQLDYPGSRIAGANRAKTTCCELLDEKQKQLVTELKTVQQEMRDVATTMVSPGDAKDSHRDSDKSQQTIEYARLFVQRLILESARRVVSSVKDRVDATCSSRLALVLGNLTSMPSIQEDSNAPDLNGIAGDKSQLISGLMIKQVEDRLEEFARQVDHQIQGRSLSQLARRDAGRFTRELAAQFDAAISTVIQDAMKQTDLNKIMERYGLDRGQVADWIRRHLMLATPKLQEQCGGDYRLLLAIPELSKPGVLSECLEQQLDETPTVIPSTSGEIILCYETEKLPLKSVLLDLIRKQPDCIEYVARLSTRIDIDWTPITSIVGS